MRDRIKQLAALIEEHNLKFSFSRHCHSGMDSYVAQGHQCGCWRCREKRGEPWDEATEAQAAEHSRIAQKRFHEDTLKFMKRASRA